MPITVPYSPLTEEEYGFSEGISESGGLYASVPYLVAWADRFTFANQVCGVSVYNGTVWTKTPPEPYAPSTNMFARSVDIKGTGEPIISPTDTTQGWSHAICTVRYQTPQIGYGTGGDPGNYNSLGQTTDERAALEWCDQEIMDAVEWYSLPEAKMFWDTYNAPPGPPDPNGGPPRAMIMTQPVRVRVAIQNMGITYHRLPFLPMNLSQAYAGSLNSSTIFGCAPETVMFLGFRTNRIMDTSGQIVQKAQMGFKWREKSWQKDLTPDGTWDTVVYSDGSPRYVLKDFLRLIQLLLPL